MTRAEAETICAALKAGKTFATRFQEQAWGLRHRDGDRFERWSQTLMAEGADAYETEDLDEEAVIALLVRWYGFDRIRAGLR